MERVITCPVCWDSDQCFEEVQETFSSYLCFHCGFMSDSRYEVDSLQLLDNLKKSPKLVQELKVEDRERNIMWFPSVINMGKLGIIFPEGTPEDYVWKYAKVIDILEEEQHMYDNYDRRLDVDGALTFSPDEFMKACDEMGITKELKESI